MHTFNKYFLTTLAAGVLVIGSFLGGYLFRDSQISADDLPILVEARDLLLKYSIEEPPKDRILEYGMIRGMIQAYGDPYTSFSEPVQHELTTNNLEGHFGGIGVQLQRDGENYLILIPLKESPAETAGILEGDRLVQVDNQLITPETPTETVQAAVRGKVGTKVFLGIQRPPDFQQLDFTIERSDFTIPSVIAFLAPTEPRLGIVKVNIMAATTPEEIIQAVKGLKARGALAYALDLRDNFGGLLTSGVDTAELFLQEGIVLREQYKGEEIKSYPVKEKGELVGLNFVVLVNGNTASAAEIAAGALQKVGKIKLIGNSTYGKDSIQLVFELDDKSSLQVTAARWWVPNEDGSRPPSIRGTGLTPDIMLDDAPTSNFDPAIQSAVDYFFLKP